MNKTVLRTLSGILWGGVGGGWGGGVGGVGGWGGGVSKSKRNFVGGVRASITKYYMGGLLKHNKIKT